MSLKYGQVPRFVLVGETRKPIGLEAQGGMQVSMGAGV
jgi:hypothetical protein